MEITPELVIMVACLWTLCGMLTIRPALVVSHSYQLPKKVLVFVLFWLFAPAVFVGMLLFSIIE